MSAKKTKNIRKRWPCLLIKIDPNNEIYKRGFRFMVEQADSDRHWFVERPRVDEFIRREGMYLVDKAQMKRHRQRAVA